MDKHNELLIKLAKKAVKNGEVPVGAFLVCNDKILTSSFNNRRRKYDITGHAEILVINKACKKRRVRYLDDCELYVTLKPCKMCQEVIREARIKKVYYLLDPLKIKENRYNYEVLYEKLDNSNYVEVYRELLRKFFENKR